MKLIKRVALAAGLYRPARLAHRLIKGKSGEFAEGKKFYAQFIKAGDLCFDIGANIGEKTEIFLSLGANVISLEPQADLALEVAARFPKTGKNRGMVIQKAAGARIGKTTLYLRESIGQASLLPEWWGKVVGTVEVATITLDALIAKYGKPNFVKIDVEGAEAFVLQGLSCAIPLLSVEYTNGPLGKARATECIRLIERFDRPLINVTGDEAHALLFQEWMTPNKFLDLFPDCIAPHSYGDLIIKGLSEISARPE